MDPILLFVAGATAVVAFYALAALNDRWRCEAMQRFCAERGYYFDPDRPYPGAELAEAFPIFDQGGGKAWKYSVTGAVNGQPFTAFEYTYFTGGGRSRRRHRFGMMLWETPGLNLPRFVLGPEDFLDRLAHRFGRQDLDFAEDDEFSQAYELRGDNPTAVRALFTPARRAFLVAAGKGGIFRPQHLAGAGTRLLWWREGRLPPAQELDQFIADGDRVRQQFLEDGGGA
ncbi:MAG TPA: hypothetical protein VKB45_02230 [Gemmatimonadales bacterium]|nr:hypothetical protein [Gemmatimonadales bacterium]